MSARSFAVSGALLGLGALLSCSARPTANGQCVRDSDCHDEALVCVARVCLPQASDYPPVAVEIAPPSSSAFALSEKPSAVFSTDTNLLADPKVSVNVHIAAADKEVFAPQGHVLLSRPSLIAGKGELTLTGELADGTVAFAVGTSALGTKASLTLRPSATPSPQPPVVRALGLAKDVTLAVPTRAGLESYTGTLLSALGDPAPAYLVRGYPGNVAEPTSNPLTSVTLTGADGGFTVLTDPMTRQSTGDGAMWLEFWDSAETTLSPRLFTDPVSTDVPAGQAQRNQWRLPAWVPPSTLRFVVGGGESVSTPLKDVALRFRTSIKSTGSGKAVYAQEGKTDESGQVDVPLLPGTLTEARLYEVAIVPPPDSPFDGKCLSSFPVAAAGTDADGPPVASVIRLSRKWQVSGTLRDAGGVPVAGAALTATRVTTAGALSCLEGLVPQSVSGSSDGKGTFILLLSPGTYRIDVEPAPGAPLPHLSMAREGELLTVASDTVQDLTFPTVQVASGHVTGPGGEPVANADVRVFRATCDVETCWGGAPPLLGAARTDATGAFRVVLPASP